MIDLQKGLGLTNICDLIRKEIQGKFETREPIKKQIRNIRKRR